MHVSSWRLLMIGPVEMMITRSLAVLQPYTLNFIDGLKRVPSHKLKKYLMWTIHTKCSTTSLLRFWIACSQLLLSIRWWCDAKTTERFMWGSAMRSDDKVRCNRRVGYKLWLAWCFRKLIPRLVGTANKLFVGREAKLIWATNLNVSKTWMKTLTNKKKFNK